MLSEPIVPYDSRLEVLLRGEDVRSVLNEILLECSDARMTNLSAQKIIYFMHGQYLLSTQTPLVSGYFEAWEYGPVHPTLYNALKYLGSAPVDRPLMRRDIHTGEWVVIERVKDHNVRDFIREASGPLLKLSAGQLVDLSHARNSPWDVVSRHENRRTWGLRLDNDVISRHFRFHKRSVSDLVRGDGFEEHPPSGD